MSINAIKVVKKKCCSETKVVYFHNDLFGRLLMKQSLSVKDTLDQQTAIINFSSRRTGQSPCDEHPDVSEPAAIFFAGQKPFVVSRFVTFKHETGLKRCQTAGLIHWSNFEITGDFCAQPKSPVFL